MSTTASMTSATQRPGATWGSRVCAYLIDVAYLIGIAGLLWWIRPSWALVILVVAQFVVVLTLVKAHTGQTPGSWAMGLATVKDGSNNAPGLRRQTIRALVMTGMHVLIVAPLVALTRVREGRDWIDRISGTRTVTLRRRDAEPSPATTAPPVSAPTPAPLSPTPPPHTLSPTPPPPPHTLSPTPPPSVRKPARHAGTEQPTPHPSAPAAFPPRRAAPQPSEQASWPDSFPSVSTAPRIAGAMPTTLRPVGLQTPGPAPRSGAWVVIDSGEREPLNTVLVIGRDPVPRGPEERAIRMPNSTSSISRTHVRCGPAPQGAWVEDTGSTNGSKVRIEGGPVTRLEPRQRITVPYGTTVMLGNRSIRILLGPPH